MRSRLQKAQDHEGRDVKPPKHREPIPASTTHTTPLHNTQFTQPKPRVAYTNRKQSRSIDQVSPEAQHDTNSVSRTC